MKIPAHTRAWLAVLGLVLAGCPKPAEPILDAGLDAGVDAGPPPPPELQLAVTATQVDGGIAVVAFEAIAGSHPFERESLDASVAAIRSGWNDDLEKHLPSDARATGALFAAALAHERQHRPGTASELAERLARTADALA